MSKSITNLTTPLVVSEIEQVLGSYPHHPYQQAFANPDSRQELVAYVLTRVHNVFAVVDEGKTIASDVEALPDLAEIQPQLASFIHQGIHDILQQHPILADHQIPEEDDGYLTASHWFG
jgi:hypothetical protein